MVVRLLQCMQIVTHMVAWGSGCKDCAGNNNQSTNWETPSVRAFRMQGYSDEDAILHAIGSRCLHWLGAEGS